ncbi:uncharacterized protein TRIADDRAFT_52186 [Trichoplax adhaerens]|uniref:Uncharacterized protein n=1 Tax=Trichoplax adhaerens TaxID=10228 RepID=B3RM03_TRIAD|nr:predicted protein [Trichoplax adhaerens]EDV29614.1 predicted protein [Trichoplax adhaerens]|eukprot:XP_002108816.1 predicted protein [Trichoplax adhaerens]
MAVNKLGSKFNLQNLELYHPKLSENYPYDCKNTEWLSCEKQKNSQNTPKVNKRKKQTQIHRQVFRKLDTDRNSVDPIDTRRHINSELLISGKPITTPCLTQTKLTSFFKYASNSFPVHGSYEGNDDEDSSMDQINKCLHTSATSTTLKNNDKLTANESDIPSDRFSSTDNCNKSKNIMASYPSGEEDVEFIKNDINLDIFTDSARVPPVGDSNLQISELHYEDVNDFVKVTDPPSPIIFTQWTQDSLLDE